MKPVLRLAAVAAAVAPLTIFGPAARADQVNWDAVAQCESSGNWAANTGNGAYGGLQIKPSTWEAYGGVGLPSQATPAQQIAVANQILVKQGPGAWPSCMSRIRDMQPDQGTPGGQGSQTVPVGTLTQFVTYLVNQLETAQPG
ncbi:MAG TPA: transglycosylase family protein [Mycobacterium sp.]|nr:transglycosylase family protein [Mycobacterium sp.]